MVAFMNLSEYMKLIGKTTTEVAKELGVSRQLIHQWKNGSRPRPENALMVERWSRGAVRKEELLYPDAA